MNTYEVSNFFKVPLGGAHFVECADYYIDKDDKAVVYCLDDTIPLEDQQYNGWVPYDNVLAVLLKP